MTEQENIPSEDHHLSNGNVAKYSSSDESKSNKTRSKVFSRSDSMLTALMDLNHVQTVYNISVAVCTLLASTAVAYYLTVPHQFWEDMSIMSWASSKIHIFCAMWIYLNMICICVHQGHKRWILNRHRLPANVCDFIFLCYFMFLVAVMFVLTPYVVVVKSLPPITAFALLAEQVRMFMKIYSFVRETFPRIRNHNFKKDGDQLKMLHPSLNHFIYFMFAPVLLYRDSYPRTEKVHWNFVFSSLARMGACIFITYCMMMRFNIDFFKNVGLEPFHQRHMAFIFAGCMFVGSLMMFMLFYAILHSWLNAFAELTRFADRSFYQDWWNSTSFLQYYRKWNTVVYDWLYTYIYLDAQKLGLSLPIARLNVFIVSSVVHDYIICFALGYFFPALGIVYTTVGVSLIFVTNQKKSSFWNTFMWVFLFSGWGVLIFLHSAEWYARKNCPVPPIGTLGYYIRSTSCLEIDNL